MTALRPTHWLLLILFCATISLPLHAGEHGIEIDRASLTRETPKSPYVLNAEIHYQLSETAIEALQNGVALTMNVLLKIQQPRDWLWSKTIYQSRLTFRLRFRTLTRIYQVVNVDTGQEANYSSLDTAVRALGHLEGMPLKPVVEIAATDPLEASLKAQLNIEALPLPMRPLAHVSPSWHHSSDWFSWPIQP